MRQSRQCASTRIPRHLAGSEEAVVVLSRLLRQGEHERPLGQALDLVGDEVVHGKIDAR
jgi:hypothetical protein